jgi:hypothetical protein
MPLEVEEYKIDSGRNQPKMVDARNNLGSNGDTAYTKPGKYQLVYLLPVLVHL